MSAYDNYPPGTWAGDPLAPWNRPDDDDLEDEEPGDDGLEDEENPEGGSDANQV